MKNILHTPEGVRDIFGKECEKKHKVDRAIKSAILSFGYEQIETPTFEFFDIFGQDIGTIPSKDLFKFFDREGNTLVLRPDVTPSVARAYAGYLKDKSPLRLFYSENVYINHTRLQGRLRETTQIGAEFIGEPSIEADAELVALAVSALESTGLSEFTISVGHVDFLRGLMEGYLFSEEEQEELYERVLNKNFFGLEELLDRRGVKENHKKLYFSMARLYASPDDFYEYEQLAEENCVIMETFDYFKKLYSLLELYGVQKHVSFDFGLVSEYRYYTGILFQGYTYGCGEAILKGGRYDDLLPYFGCEEAAIGFAILSDSLSIALERQGIDVPLFDRKRAYIYTYFNEDEYKTVLKQAMKDRKEGIQVSLYPVLGEEEEIIALYERLKEDGIEVIWKRNI